MPRRPLPVVALVASVGLSLSVLAPRSATIGSRITKRGRCGQRLLDLGKVVALGQVGRLVVQQHGVAVGAQEEAEPRAQRVVSTISHNRRTAIERCAAGAPVPAWAPARSGLPVSSATVTVGAADAVAAEADGAHVRGSSHDILEAIHRELTESLTMQVHFPV
jgi:hypothetical protein